MVEAGLKRRFWKVAKAVACFCIGLLFPRNFALGLEPANTAIRKKAPGAWALPGRIRMPSHRRSNSSNRSRNFARRPNSPAFWNGTLLKRHVTGDWGDVNEDDRRENGHSLVQGCRLLSAYTLSNGTRLWVITEADRSATTILLPSEYYRHNR